MGLKNEIEKLKFDKRLSEWHVARGLMKQEELNKHIASIPDSASNVADSGPAVHDEEGETADGELS